MINFEPIYGNVRLSKRSIPMKEILVIGSDKRCDLVVAALGVSPMHCRLFLKDGFIYVDDFNSATGTAVNGMRIHAPNKLTSGSELMVGSIVLRCTFTVS